MATKRLMGIDQIVSSTGKVYDVGTLPTSGKIRRIVGVDQVVTSDAGFTIDVNAVGYAPHGADGHKSGASHVMFGGGSHGYTYYNTCDLKQFSSTANAVDHGDLQIGRDAMPAGSDGTQIMFGGGRSVTSGTLDKACDLKLFASTATAVGHGFLSVSRTSSAAGSDGTQVMFGGGYSNFFSTTCDLKLFASDATATDHGDLTARRFNLTAGSDGTQVMFGGGSDEYSHRNTCDMKQFSSASYSADHGDLTAARYGPAAGSDSTQVMFVSGLVPVGKGSEHVITCDMKHFASTSIAVAHGNLTQARHELAGGSDGTQVMFGGGHNGSTYVNTCDMKQFSSASYSADHGDLSQGKFALAAGSGSA